MFRRMLNIFDEHQSRENAKHVHRAMLENARQGFWNGSRRPFGYRGEIAERRGPKDKKILVIEAAEGKLDSQTFDLAMGSVGRTMGVEAMPCWLQERGSTLICTRFATERVPC